MSVRIRASRKTPTAPKKRTRSRRRAAMRNCAAAAAVFVLIVSAMPVAAQGACTAREKNMQCNEFGKITMDSQRDIRGSAIDLDAVVTLDTSYFDQEARWILFSIRNVTDDGSNPVTIVLTKFSTSAGSVVTTRVEQPSANELNLWVDTLDAPVGKPITIGMQIGATERGAYRLETLVMAFDRGYSPIADSRGQDVSLFSFTLLGVNKESAAIKSDGGSIWDGKKLPGPEIGALIAALVVVAAIVRRRSSE